MTWKFNFGPSTLWGGGGLKELPEHEKSIKKYDLIFYY